MATVYVKRYATRSRIIYIVRNDNLCFSMAKCMAVDDITDEMCQQWIDSVNKKPAIESMMDPPNIESTLETVYDDGTQIKKKQKYQRTH